MKKASLFSHFARIMSKWLGHPLAFGLAALLILIWIISGPIFHFSDTWQLVINTGTTIITFLMVFLIQNTQNRDSEAMQLKLDELIRAVRQADNTLLDSEDLTEQDLEQLHEHYINLAHKITSRSSKQKQTAKRAKDAQESS